MSITILPRPIWTPPAVIHPWSRESIGPSIINFAAPTSSAYPTATKAFYIPFTIPDTCVVVKLFLVNGATLLDTLDLGIYNDAGTRLVSSGATAQAGASVVQAVDITDLMLSGPALYYMAVSFLGITGTLLRTVTNSFDTKGAGVLEQTSAHPLPATATFATTTVGYVPMIGIAMRTVLD